MIGVIFAKNGKFCEPFGLKIEKNEKQVLKIVSKCFKQWESKRGKGRISGQKIRRFSQLSSYVQ